MIVKLSRMVNVLPGDRSVVQDFSISGGKVAKTGTVTKQLSTGKPLSSPESVWLPDLAIKTATKMFPFFALLGHSALRTSGKSCVKTL
jgi:hypothetical protein